MGKFYTAVLVGLWWICSIWANVYSKKVFFHLNDFALQLTFAQTSTAVFVVGLLFESKLFKEGYFSQLIQKISIKGWIILSLLHAFGNLFTNVSMESTNVAFAHTVKAAEPIFTIYFSRLMGKHEPVALYLSTVPVMLGVAIASLAEVQFSVLGFVAAVLSNSCFAYRNVSVKKLEEVDNLGIFFLVSCGSSVILAIIHALRTTFHEPSPENEDFADAFFYLVCAAVLHCCYNLFSFLVLQQVAPLTHAVINLVKRGAVIFVAILTFSTPVNALNMTGILTTLGGGALFSFLKLRFSKKTSGPPPDVDEEAKPAPPPAQPRPSIMKLLIVIGFVFLAAAVSKPIPGVSWVIWEETDGNLEVCPTESWRKTIAWEAPEWRVVQVNHTKIPIIAMFGYTAMQKNYHFGQYGASYAADREIRQLLGEEVIIIPFSPMDIFEARMEANLPLVQRVFYNWEGTFHGVGNHNKNLMNNVKKIATLNVPTYHFNIAWYPPESNERMISNTLKNMTTLKHLAARDESSYNSMKNAGLDMTLPSADLTFLLPNNFSCEVNRLLAEKNKFWTYPGKLRVLVTMTSAEDDVKQAIYDAVTLLTDELEGHVDVVSILDWNVKVGVRTLEHLMEDNIYEAMWLLKHADVVITGRFHCGTYARIAGVPAVLLPGNTPKLEQLSKMINSPAYPIVNKPADGQWGQAVWNKAKEAINYAKQHSLEHDGIVDRLHALARNNFPFQNEDPFFSNRVITMEEMERQTNFQGVIKNATTGVFADKVPDRFGISYDPHKKKYILNELV